MIPPGATSHGTSRPILLLVAGIPLLLLSLFVTVERATMEVDGVIVSAATQCVSNNYRCVTIYTVGSSRGHTTYRVAHTDGALRADLPVGTHLVKHHWALDYTVDGQQMSDFPTPLYASLGVVGLFLTAYGTFQMRRIIWSHMVPKGSE